MVVLGQEPGPQPEMRDPDRLGGNAYFVSKALLMARWVTLRAHGSLGVQDKAYSATRNMSMGLQQRVLMGFGCFKYSIRP